MPTTHTLRSVQSLNGLWDFAFLGDVDLATFSPRSTAQFFDRMPVPAAFDALPAYAGKRGTAVYHTSFHLPVKRAAKIFFEAVSMWSRVYIDGAPVHENACGYAPFWVDVPPATHSVRELTVVVDNRFDFQRVPMHEEYFDFYQYGGLIREVTLHLLPEQGAFIRHALIAPGANYREGEIEIALMIDNVVGDEVVVALSFDNSPANEGTDIAVHEGQGQLRARVPQPRLWAPASPYLHRLRIELRMRGTDVPIDDVVVRFGLRAIEARDGALWLNGEKLKLRGYNRHEWHPNFGPCTPPLQMVADLQLLREMGCNFVRGSHYQQDQRFLALCDEFGLLVWEENLGWGQRERTFASEKFQSDHAQALRSMVLHSYNHPSVIIWGFLNEAGTDAGYVRPVFEDTVTLLRRLDRSRLISYASMFALTDRYFDLVDVISLNVYPGWYNCEDHPRPLELVRPHLERCLAHIDAAGWEDKPVLISEIGAEALYGWHDAHHDFFTEEYQAAYLREACTVALTNERCSGIALWHFSDVRTYSGGRSLKRPRAFNNKGTLDEYRRPKQAFGAVREVFRNSATES